MVIERFFEDWFDHRHSLPPELGQVGINLKTAELHLYGEARECIERRLAAERHRRLFNP